MALDILLSFCTTNWFKLVSALIFKSKYQLISSENVEGAPHPWYQIFSQDFFMKNKQAHESHCIKFILLLSLAKSERIRIESKCPCNLLSLNVYITVLMPIYQESCEIPLIKGVMIWKLRSWHFLRWNCSHKNHVLFSLRSRVLLSIKAIIVQKAKQKEQNTKKLCGGVVVKWFRQYLCYFLRLSK